MSATHEFEVKIQLPGGTTTITRVFAENDFKARQLVKMQYGDSIAIHYVRKIS